MWRMGDCEYQCRCCGASISGPRQCDHCGVYDPLQIALGLAVTQAAYQFHGEMYRLGALTASQVREVEECGTDDPETNWKPKE